MKLNNKGFAISTFMYMILVLAIILVLATLAILSSRKMILDRQKTTTIDKIKTAKREAGTAKSYVGYYADIDSDGIVDGVIYADLAHSKSGKWGPYSNNQYEDYGQFSYTAQTNLKEYTISKNKYREGNFGEKEIVTLKPNSTGNARFYVMALNDFTTGSMTGDYEGYYYWYKNARGKMDTWETDTSVNFGTGYANTGTLIDIWNAGVNGKYGAQQDSDHYDIWEHIQGEYAKGWFMPSRGEWGAFSDYLAHSEENPLTSNYNSTGNNYSNNGNYDDIYGLKSTYWTSSHGNSYLGWFIDYYSGRLDNTTRGSSTYVRLSVTF